MQSLYPAHWEADVVLSDGATAHLRPITPEDADRLVLFYERVSDQSKYYRFFAPYPRLTAQDVDRFTHVDHDARVAFIVVVGEDMIAVGRYDRVGRDTAEVAFLVEDAHQGRGLGSVLLEHLAAAARERGVRRFVAEVLPANRRMLTVFQDAGYSVEHELDEGIVSLTFDIEPTVHSIEVMASREHRAEARSIEALLRPRRIAVVGASRTYATVGQSILRHLVEAGFTGEVVAVNPEADQVAGIPAYPAVRDVPGPLDLAVVAVPAGEVDRVVTDCARKGVRGLVVVSAGFAETGEAGRDRQRRLVRTARANGMRVVGPNSFGMINTDPAVRLNASLAPTMPTRGRIGFFSQSGALGIAILEAVSGRGLGLSTFVSAGNRADVSGNDLLQYWEEDPDTDVVMLYLESVGNPRKFSRLARRVARSKPVAVVKSGTSAQMVPLGHAVRRSKAPAAALDAMFRQSGVIRVETIHQLFDVAALLATQPLPTGDRVAILGNSDALGLLAAGAAEAWGLHVVGEPLALGAEATAEDFRRALAAVFADPAVDSVVAVFIPPLLTLDEDVASVLAEAAARATKTVVSTFLGMRGVPAALRAGSDGRGAVPSYPTPEDAVRALVAATRYAQWRRRPIGSVPALPDVDVAAARQLVEQVLAECPDGRALTRDETAALLLPFGVKIWPAVPVHDIDSAVAAAEALGYPVALKATARALRHRIDLGGIHLGLADEADLRQAYAQLVRLQADDDLGLVVQPMAGPGLAVVVSSAEDPLLGPYLAFGIGGVVSELLGDLAYRIPPLTDVDAAEMVRSVRAAPMLFGHRGAEPVDVAAVEDLLLRVSRLADELPEVASLELNPVVVGAHGLVVLAAEASVAHPAVRTDSPRRSLPG
ncbi:MAG TPA: GNAT family N-acetyltransferase [Actinomycetes bacterium]|nr:GNAT family N-acetyltransferase [Actinomycetes bacterium]